MSYRYLDNVATADVAFTARGRSMEELFREAADATVNAMVENLSAIRDRTEITCSLSADSAEMLLFQLLQEIVFYKDARQLLLRVKKARIEQEDGSFLLHCTLCGERIDRERHDMLVDVKAVTLYRYRVEKTSRGYRATVVLDV